MAAAVEWISKLTVAPPLQLQDTPAGPVLTLPFTDQMFICNVQQDGGVQGTQTSAATWTYTLTRLGVTIGTGIAQDRPRPFGTATYQSGSSGFGIAFYGSDGNIHLWDAGEVYGSGTCP